MAHPAVADRSARPASGAVSAVPEDVRAVANTFVDLVRTSNRIRGRWLAAAAHDVEWSAHVVLKTVAANGPLRASALAGCLHSDPSTISRQVAALVKEGLLERRADPEDGRASLLAITDHARDVLAAHDEIRMQHFADMLEGWSERDLHKFAALLRRFTDDLSRSGDAMLPAPRASEPNEATTHRLGGITE